MSLVTTSAAMKDILWQSIKGDPRYRAFAEANNLASLEETRQSIYQDLLKEHGDRIKLYKYYDSLYHNAQWYALSSDESPYPTAMNYNAMTVNKHASFLMNKGFLVESHFPEIERFLQKTWSLNFAGTKGTNRLGLEMAVQGGITGDLFLHYEWDVDAFSQMYMKFDIIRSQDAFPVFDNDVMKGFLEYKLTRRPQEINSGFAKYESKFEGRYFSPGQVEIIREENVVNTIPRLSYEIPVIHIKNYPTTFNYGLSDLVGIDKLSMNMNEVLNEVNKIIKYHASPVTIITGARGDDLIRGVNRVWSIVNKDAKVSNLQLSGELGAVSQHLEMLRNAIAEAGNVPESTLGKMSNISNTSGSAIAITFMPLYEVMEMKRIMYGTSFLDLNARIIKEAILMGELDVNKILKAAEDRWKIESVKMTDAQKKIHYPFSQKVVQSYNYNSLEAIYENKIPREIYETFITWFPPLPREEKALVELSNANVKNQIWSRRHARSVQGMGEKESILMENEILTEAKKYQPVTMTNSSKVKELRNDDDLKGETESRRKEEK